MFALKKEHLRQIIELVRVTAFNQRRRRIPGITDNHSALLADITPNHQLGGTRVAVVRTARGPDQCQK
jgi:hypothetical protein